MSHLFYDYKVYTKNGVEHTKLKWFVDGTYADSAKIDAPTADITAGEQIALDEFITEGSVCIKKEDITLPAPLTGGMS